MAYIHMACAVGLAILWVTTVSICTFEKPFAGIAGICTGRGSQQACSANGYMATWIACAATIAYLLKAVPFVHKLTDKIPKDGPKQLLAILFFASGLVLWHSSYWCWKSENNKPANGSVCKCDGLLLYALICSCTSCLLALLFGLIQKLAEHIKWMAAFMVVWWFCGVASLTFKSGSSSCNPCWDCGVFYDANNGFFGTWVSFFASFALVGATWGVSLNKASDTDEGKDGTEMTPDGSASAITQEGPGVEKSESVAASVETPAGDAEIVNKDESQAQDNGQGAAKTNEETSI